MSIEAAVTGSAAFHDDSIYEQRYQKAATGLLALHDALLEQRPLDTENETAFLEQVAWLRGQPDEAFGRVWQDPTTYWWVRNGYHLMAVIAGTVEMTGASRELAHALEAKSPEQALDQHLGQFPRFTLGVAVCAGVERRLRPALDVTLPFVIPGTHLIIDGDGPARILGTDGRTVDLASGGARPVRLALTPDASGAGVHVREPVTLARGGDNLALLPELYANLPGLAFTSALEEADHRFQRRYASLVAAALGSINRYAPETHRSFLDHTWSVALKPLKAGGFTNMAYSELPGTFIAGTIPNALEMADTLIHEFHHHHLFFLEEPGPFFAEDGPDPLADERFYSPWRPDPRPLHGLLHGTFVYTPVNDFWLQALRSGELNQADREYAVDRLVRGVAQVTIGIRQLERHAVLTARGQMVLDAIRQRLADCLGGARSLTLPNPSCMPALLCDEQGDYQPQTTSNDRNPLSLAHALQHHIDTAASDSERGHVQADLQAFLRRLASA